MRKRALQKIRTSTPILLVLGSAAAHAGSDDAVVKELRTGVLYATVSPRGLGTLGVIGEEEPMTESLNWRWLRRPKGRKGHKGDQWPGTMGPPKSFELEQTTDGTISLWQTYDDFDFRWTVSTAHEWRALKVNCVAIARRDFRSGEWGAQMPQVTWSQATSILYPSEGTIAEMPVRGAKPIHPKTNWVAIKRKPGLSSLLVVGLTPGWEKRVRVIPGFFTNIDWPKMIYKGDELRMTYLLAPYTGSIEMALQEFLPREERPRIELPKGFAFWPAHGLEMIPVAAADVLDRLSGAKLTVSLCRGEVEPCQVVLTPATGKQFRQLSLRFSPLRHADGQGALPASAMDWTRVRYVNGVYADVLEPVVSFDTIPGLDRNYPMWVRVRVPRDARPGDYRSSISLLAEGRLLAELPLAVHVWDFELPRKCPLNSALFGFWPNFMEAHFGFGHRSDAEKRMMRAGCESLAAHHLLHTSDTTGMVPWRPSPAHLLTPAGEQELFQWCQFWSSRGLRLGELRVYEEAFWRHYWPIFKAKGWDREIYSGHWDEYSTLGRAREACAVAERLREIAPGLRFMSTAIGAGLTVHEAADPGTDIWSTTPRIFTEQREFFDGRRRAGEPVWLYIHHHIKFTASQAAPRVFFWQLSRLGLDGCCLYGMNVWGKEPMQWTPQGLVQAKTYVGYPLGCGVLYWPGKDRLLESVRLEKIRDGIEDWMYLGMLHERLSQAKDAGGAGSTWVKQARIALRLRDALVHDRILPGEVFSHNSDPAAFDEIRAAVGDALAAR